MSEEQPNGKSRYRIPQIKFGDEFEQWDDSRKIRYLKELASSMNEAARLMQNERNSLAAELAEAKALVVNAEKALHIQKAVTMSQLGSGNEQVQILSKQIMDLQTRVKAQDVTIKTLNAELGR